MYKAIRTLICIYNTPMQMDILHEVPTTYLKCQLKLNTKTPCMCDVFC